jgi:phage terminase large subunit
MQTQPKRVDLSSYAPINAFQEEFHQCQAPHRAMIGGFSAGKTYPMMHEIIRHCLENPKHNYAIFRDTWDVVIDNIQKEFVSLCQGYGLVKDWRSSSNTLVLINECTILFLPLELDISKFKGMCLCGFAMDDVDTSKYADKIGMLYSRLRDRPGVKATSFRTLFAANYEGEDWIINTFAMRNGKFKPQGEWSKEDPYAYWFPPTTANTTLSEDYIPTLAKIHSQEWMDRYVYMKNLERHSGLVYPEFNMSVHVQDLSKCADPEHAKEFIKILATDVGTGTTAIYKMAADTGGKAIYIYGEFYEHAASLSQIAEYVHKEQETEVFNTHLIDPSSARPEQTSGKSVKGLLKDKYMVHTVPAVNDVKLGIMLVKDLLAPASGLPRLYVDPRCVNFLSEIKHYRFMEDKGKGDGDDTKGFKEQVRKRKDHAMDATRYGVVYLNKFLTKRMEAIRLVEEQRRELQQKRLKSLPMYKKYGELGESQELGDLYRKLKIGPRHRKSAFMRAMRRTLKK